jgi:diguanylate cyclase (GGDEF)-like protein
VNGRTLLGLGAGVLVTAGVVAVAADRRRLAGQLATAQQSVLEDPLTGLANRAGLDAGLAQITAAGQSYGLLLLDLDGFKQVNDTLGHDTGDLVLVEVSNRLVDLVDTDAVVARLGGDEFVVAAPSPAPGISARLARQAVEALRQPFDRIGVTVPIGVSVGVVHASAGEPVRAVLHTADVAMYRAKTAGGGFVEHDPFAGLLTPETTPTARLRDMHGLGRRAATAKAVAA